MIRCALVLGMLAGGVALADPPKFSQGGFLFSVSYGPGFWTFDRALLASQMKAPATAADADLFIADFTATGWDITTPQRGGAGMLTGYVAWHPLELVWMKKETRPIGLDVSTMFGVGYGICGENRGMDGLVLQWGLNADYFFARYFGAGLFAKGTFLQWDKFYLDYNNRDLPGNTIAVAKGAGASFWTIGVALTFRAGD